MCPKEGEIQMKKNSTQWFPLIVYKTVRELLSDEVIIQRTRKLDEIKSIQISQVPQGRDIAFFEKVIPQL